jgi:hypothetical protein
MDWRCGWSSRVPALQMWSLEFRPQSHKKVNYYSERTMVKFEIRLFRRPVNSQTLLRMLSGSFWVMHVWKPSDFWLNVEWLQDVSDPSTQSPTGFSSPAQLWFLFCTLPLAVKQKVKPKASQWFASRLHQNDRVRKGAIKHHLPQSSLTTELRSRGDNQPNYGVSLQSPSPLLYPRVFFLKGL